MIETFVKLAPSKNKSAVLEVATRLQARYGESQRKHHTWEHLEHGLAEYRAVSDAPLGTINFFAWAYHDSHYIPADEENEERSAVIFLADAEMLGFDTDETDEGMFIIRSTVPYLPASSVVNDMDLCILGGTHDEYFEYVRRVRNEYKFVSDEVWKVGRSAILQEFISRQKLYHTLEFAAKFTHAAHQNMKSELDILNLM